jgi:DNA-binding response OmpR family regulator
MATKILVIEDDRNISDLLQLYLEKEGYAVTTAPDGRQGMDKFHSFQPDLVLLDIMMPVIISSSSFSNT